MVCGILPFGDNQIHRLIAKKEVALQFQSPHALSTGMQLVCGMPLKVHTIIKSIYTLVSHKYCYITPAASFQSARVTSKAF